MEPIKDFSTLKIEEIQGVLKKLKPTLELVDMLRTDQRKGVLKLADQLERQIQLEGEMKHRFQSMLKYEHVYWSQDLKVVVGVDEAGRGPLAGPVVAAAVVIEPDFCLLGLNDSKELTEEQREDYFTTIMERALGVGIGIVDHTEIDQINILQASFKAMRLALDQLKDQGLIPEVVLVDGDKIIPEVDTLQHPLVGGDRVSVSIAAASVVAKVTRDRLMVELAKKYPGYGFERNKGYGSPEHLAGLRKQGPSGIHRLTFSIVRQALYSTQYHAYVEQLLAVKELAALKEVGLLIGRHKDGLGIEEIKELRQLYVKMEKKIKN